MKLEGTFTALITPFKKGKVDFKGFKKHVKFQIDNGIDGLLPLGTTGETPTINSDEQTQIIQIAVQEAAGKVPVMVGTGSNSTEHTIENTKKAKELGADCVLVVTPYYNKPTQEGIFNHFKAVTDAVDIPVVVYNIQGRTGKNIETPTLKRIAGLTNIIGVKEASGNMGQMGDVIHQIVMETPQFVVMSGDDQLTFPLIAMGGRGIISVISNLVPDKVVNMVNTALAGEFDAARSMHYELLPLIHAAFVETNPIPIKAAMALCGLIDSDEVRLPMSPLLDENRKKVKSVLKEMGLL